MGIIVCQTCNSVIDHCDSDKVQVLYAKCDCKDCKSKESHRN